MITKQSIIFCNGFVQIPLLVVIVSFLLASTGLGVALYKKGELPFIPNKEVIESTPTPTPLVEMSPSPSIFPKPTINAKDQNKVENKPIIAPVPIITETQQTKVDSSVGIEQCRTYAKEKRKEEEEKVNEEYARSEPAMVELAAAQNNGETEAAALKYGIITQSQVVRRSEVFESLLSQGYPMSEAEKAATIAGDDYSSYLNSLHDWAVNELGKWNAVVKNKFDTYESQVYQNCLSSL